MVNRVDPGFGIVLDHGPEGHTKRESVCVRERERERERESVCM